MSADQIYSNAGFVNFSFVKTFTKGILEGIALTESMWFENRAAFDGWIKGVNKNHKRGVIDYSVIPA